VVFDRSKKMQLWQGRFQKALDPKTNDFNSSIAFDSRNNSALFAIEAAKTLAFYGIKTYIFDSLRPTPELSFAVRFLKCSAGIVVTASHNPKEYNGYKVYGDDGAQVVFEAADAIMKNMNETDILEDVHTADEKEAREKGLINTIGAEVDEAFYKAVASVAINPEVIKKANLSICLNINYLC